MENVLDKKGIVKDINCLSVVNQLVETIWVDTTQGEIETCRVTKESGIVRSVIQKIKYSLKSFNLFIKSASDEESIIISDLPSQQTISKNKSVQRKTSDEINKLFINEIDNFKNTQKEDFPYFRKGIIPKIMGWNNKNRLLKKIKNISNEFSWVIIPESLITFIQSDSDFKQNTKREESIFRLLGVMGETSIYINPSEHRKVVYFGNYDSITILLNKNLEHYDHFWNLAGHVNKTLKIEYLVFENGLTKRLNLE